MTEKTKKIHVVVNLQFEAIHCWAGVKEAMPSSTHIHFLQQPHRHIFHVRAEKEVLHNDRDVEIIDFKQQIIRFLDETYGYLHKDLGSTSCEMLAEQILEKFSCSVVEVLEDGENGARVELK